VRPVSLSELEAMAIRQALERLVGIENKPRRDSEPFCLRVQLTGYAAGKR
jgi:hypothetical protein